MSHVLINTRDPKRIELHAHSLMSTMDATNGIKDYVKQASDWGMDAIAITDTAGAQGFLKQHLLQPIITSK